MNRDVSAPYQEQNNNFEADTARGQRPADASNAGDGYDEAQRAEIAEYEGGGRIDGEILTDMDADMGEDLDESEVENDLDGLTMIIDTNEDQ